MDDYTNQLQHVAIGTEYRSPEQHGGIYGNIYRRYYAIPDAPGTGSTVNIPLGFTLTGDPVSIHGMAELQAGGEWYPLPFTDFGSATRNIELRIVPPNIVMVGGSGVDWQAGGYIWMDYTK